MASPVIIITGASRGIGLAIAHQLLAAPSSPSLILVARTASPLESLKASHPSRIDYVTGDLSAPLTCVAAVKKAIDTFGRVDGLVINHGTLGQVAKITEADVKLWQEAFAVNLFSAVALVKEAAGELRKNRGRVVFVSSGAAKTSYEGWGVYGASKAALNHVCATVAAEEKEITAVAVRPGVMDTEMQKEIREQHKDAMGGSHERFVKLHEEGKLLNPEQPGAVIAKLVLGADKALSGQFLSWDDEALAAYH